MNDHQEHISHYSAADIQRYVQGKLSAAEMHAMEKAALDDPFLADAMEGMQQAFTEHQESVVTGELQQLQQNFQTRTSGKAKVVAFKPFRYWQATAAAVVVIIAGVWIYSLVNRNAAENNTAAIAKTEKKELPPQQRPAPSVTDEKIGAADSVTPPAAAAAKTNDWYRNKERVNNKPVAPNVPNAAATSAQPSTQSNSIAKKDVTAELPKQPQNDADSYFAKPEMKEVAVNKNKEAAPSAAAPIPPVKALRNDSDMDKWQEREAETELITIAKTESKARKAVTKDKNLSGVIKGQVTDHFNNPVANAYVQLQKNNNNNFINNFITDKSGYFKIPVTDSVVNVAVNVSGYGTQNFILQNNTGMNQLQLQPANYAYNNFNNKYSQSGAVNNNNKQLAANFKFPNVVLYDAEPAYGWVAFGQYLEKNKIIPAGSETVSGNVVLSFDVNKRGELSDYKIEQSLSKAHDEEAIRLIRQGPSWKLRSGRKARVTVMVRF